MDTKPTTFCLTTCCRSAVVTLAIGLAALAAAGSLGGAPAANPLSGSTRPVLNLQHPHVVVLKSKRRLLLFDGGSLVRAYPIALGPEPAGDKRQAGDGRTPEGVFRICTRSADSPYHRFLGINYPNSDTARQGLERGLLTAGEAQAIIAAIDEGRCPSWLTPLGGAIGLHGCGAAGACPGSDWTAGCIALADRDVEELFEVLRLGDVVEILP